ncbi:hypothetical protein [Geodermatophilus nigrescens]|uniref:GAF domain-containing protein n=1 Tax=Geodermatophilus nigrescens TaxID=1070870 RepID=A0A1M5F0F8_9ACTN|nr:hypothetical protein [Geodermatophilus nigrescens]SHF85023.1 hypothetical protein SAMN05444351_1022 [Geodermatophilus nigrescens]
MTRTAGLDLAEIAASTRLLPQRSQEMLRTLRRRVPFDAAWMALAEPMGSSYTCAASTDTDHRTLEYLSGPGMARDIEVTGTDRARPPLSVSDLPYPAADLPTWADCLIPAGLNEAPAVALYDRGGRHVGSLALLYGSGEPPSPVGRGLLRQ